MVPGGPHPLKLKSKGLSQRRGMGRQVFGRCCDVMHKESSGRWPVRSSFHPASGSSSSPADDGGFQPSRSDCLLASPSLFPRRRSLPLWWGQRAFEPLEVGRGAAQCRYRSLSLSLHACMQTFLTSLSNLWKAGKSAGLLTQHPRTHELGQQAVEKGKGKGAGKGNEAEEGGRKMFCR